MATPTPRIKRFLRCCEMVVVSTLAVKVHRSTKSRQFDTTASQGADVPTGVSGGGGGDGGEGEDISCFLLRCPVKIFRPVAGHPRCVLLITYTL
jgi:hypothetical protein